MPIKSTIIDGIIYTELSGEIDFDTVIQQIDFISSLKNKIANRYELLDHTNITKMNISSDEIHRLAMYSKKTEDVFPISFAAVYAPNDLTFGKVRMFMSHYELAGHSINVSIFRNKEEAIQFLKHKKSEHGQQLY
jgi:hypothetical protein